MAFLRVIGGIEAGDQEAPPVWEDQDDGVRRLLRSVGETKPDLLIIVTGRNGSAKLDVFSNCESAELTMGFLARGLAHVERWVLSQETVEAPGSS